MLERDLGATQALAIRDDLGLAWMQLHRAQWILVWPYETLILEEGKKAVLSAIPDEDTLRKMLETAYGGEVSLLDRTLVDRLYAILGQFIPEDKLNYCRREAERSHMCQAAGDLALAVAIKCVAEDIGLVERIFLGPLRLKSSGEKEC